jgi:triacylglycerol lipase
MVPIIKLLHQAGHPVHVLDELRRNRKSVAATAQTVAGYIRSNDLREVVIVAHSKGGLIGKYTMLFCDDDHRIALMVAICSPFSGSRFAPYLLLPSLRAFSPRDPTTLLLQSKTQLNNRIVSIFGEFDPHIPEGSALTGASNVLIHSGGHFQILRNPATLRSVLAAVDPPRSDA